MPVPLAVPHHPAHVSGSFPSTAYLRRRAATLRISASAFDACETVGALQHVAKAQFRVLAKRYHPDHSPMTPHIGHTFRRVAAAYSYLMALPATAPLHGRSAIDTLWLDYRRLCEPLGYGVASERDDGTVESGWQVC